MRFRTKLAAEAGIALQCMRGYAITALGKDRIDELEICAPAPKGIYTPGPFIGFQPVIEWESLSDDIVPLLNHSDCDGELTPDECRTVAPRLRELVAGWPDDDRDKRQALDLADGMELAATNGESLTFH